ncbi:MAG: DNA polymerase I [Eubacteriales bacterium]
MKKLLAVDGNSILNRAYYGVRMLTNGEGFPTNALFGLVNILEKQLEALSPDYAAVAFDLKAPTFRHKMYSEYKAGRKPMPEELAMQFPVAKELCRAMGFRVLEAEGYEADDILGTLAALAKNGKDIKAYILTGDRDSLQLITEDGSVSVLLASNTETALYDAAKFHEKYGVSPNVFVDVKALMGDSSDNIPGVPGIGEKTALKLISEYGSLDSLYEALPNASLTPSVKTKLECGRNSAYMSRDLARIFCEVPLGIGDGDIKTDGANRKELLSLFTKLGFSAFIKRFGLENVQSEEKSTPSPAVLHVTSADIASFFHEKETPVSVFLSNGVFSFCDGEKINVFDGDLRELAPIFENSSIKIVTHDCKEMYKALEGAGIRFRSCFFDVMLAAYVLSSGDSSFDLPHLALKYLGMPSLPKGTEAHVISLLFGVISEKIREGDFGKLLFDIEMPLAAVLADMEIAGFRTDVKGLEEYGKQLDRVADSLRDRIYFAAGKTFNINSPVQLGDVLFETLGLPAGKKNKSSGHYSTSAEILEKLRPYHPIIDDILDFRKVTKLKSTYVDGLIKVADESGRVHSCFHQTGTATGRLSSSDPNLQNIPVRTDIGRELRRFFVPRDNSYVLIDADYSQIELRVLASLSGDKAMTDAFLSGKDIHASTASAVFGVPAESITPELRKRAKAINFGIVYGMGEFSLSQDLGISRAEAKKYIESYFAGFPNIRSYLSGLVAGAYENGYVTTMFGRRRYIPELAGQNKNLKNFGERVAKNSPIQGSAADIIKIAMIEVDRRLRESGLDARLILQVHDELILESSRDCADKAAKLLEECMENAVRLSVPLVAHAEVGDNWYETK